MNPTFVSPFLYDSMLGVSSPSQINGKPISVQGGHYTLQDGDLVSFAMNLSADEPPPLGGRDLRYYFRFTGDTMPFDTGDHTSERRPSSLPPRRSSTSARNPGPPNSYSGSSRRRRPSRRGPPLERDREARREYDSERDLEREHDASTGYTRVERECATHEKRRWERVREISSSSHGRGSRHDRSAHKPYSRTRPSGPSRSLTEFHGGR